MNPLALLLALSSAAWDCNELVRGKIDLDVFHMGLALHGSDARRIKIRGLGLEGFRGPSIVQMSYFSQTILGLAGYEAGEHL